MLEGQCRPNAQRIKGEPNQGVPKMNELSELSASEARQLIGRGDISPTELLEACISRIEAVNPKVNAIVATDLKQARREAKIAENAVLAGNALPPLHGLPIVIKD